MRSFRRSSSVNVFFIFFLVKGDADLIKEQLIVCVGFQIVLQRPQAPGVVFPRVTYGHLTKVNEATDTTSVEEDVGQAKIAVDDRAVSGFGTEDGASFHGKAMKDVQCFGQKLAQPSGILGIGRRTGGCALNGRGQKITQRGSFSRICDLVVSTYARGGHAAGEFSLQPNI